MIVEFGEIAFDAKNQMIKLPIVANIAATHKTGVGTGRTCGAGVMDKIRPCPTDETADIRSPPVALRIGRKRIVQSRCGDETADSDTQT